MSTVLIVDDSEDIRHFAKLVLEAEGFDVVGQAGSGAEGVEMAGELQPNVVLLDLAMPDMDGLQALPQILAASPGVKVVVLSGFDREFGEQAIALGASHYVQKGCRLSEVLLAVKQVEGPDA